MSKATIWSSKSIDLIGWFLSIGTLDVRSELMPQLPLVSHRSMLMLTVLVDLLHCLICSRVHSPDLKINQNCQPFLSLPIYPAFTYHIRPTVPDQPLSL